MSEHYDLKWCNNCGSKTEHEDNFCMICGCLPGHYQDEYGDEDYLADDAEEIEE